LSPEAILLAIPSAARVCFPFKPKIREQPAAAATAPTVVEVHHPFLYDCIPTMEPNTDATLNAAI
jgi:hypothetical protein